MVDLIRSDGVHLSVWTEAVDMLFVDDERRRNDARGEMAVEVRVLGEHGPIPIDQCLPSLTEHLAAGEVDQLDVSCIDRGERIDITCVVCVELRLCAFFRCSFGHLQRYGVASGGKDAHQHGLQDQEGIT